MSTVTRFTTLKIIRLCLSILKSHISGKINADDYEIGWSCCNIFQTLDRKSTIYDFNFNFSQLILFDLSLIVYLRLVCSMQPAVELNICILNRHFNLPVTKICFM